MPAAIFVTGATGFLGSNLVKRLYKKKHKITIFATKNSFHKSLCRLKIKREEGDIRNYNSVLKAMKGSSYVYHLAGLTSDDPEKKDELFAVNVLGTENVMRACLRLGVKKVVHVSSTSVLGVSKDEKIKLTEECYPDLSDTLYGYTKRLGEDKVKRFVAKGLNAVIVNPCSVLGAGEVVQNMLSLIRSISERKIKLTFPGGTSFVAVDDVVSGMLLAMRKGRKGQRYILAAEYLRFRDRYNKIAEILKKPTIKFELPRMSFYPMYFLAVIMQKLKKNPSITPAMIKWAYGFRNYDCTKAGEELGWSPKTTFEQAIVQAINYYRKNNMLSVGIA